MRSASRAEDGRGRFTSFRTELGLHGFVVFFSCLALTGRARRHEVKTVEVVIEHVLLTCVDTTP